MNRWKRICMALVLLVLVNAFCTVPVAWAEETGPAPTASVPSAPVPTSITAALNGSKIDVVWEGESITADTIVTGSTTSYEVEVSINGGAYTSVVNYTYAAFPVCSSPFTYSYTPEASGSYHFRVTGRAGSSASEPVATAAAVDFVLPLIKPSLTTKLGNGAVSLSWTAVPEAESYAVTVMDGSDTVISDKCISGIPAAATQASITGLTEGAVYKFSVTAGRGSELVASDISAPLTYTVPVLWQSTYFGNGVATAYTVTENGFTSAYNNITANAGNVVIESKSDKGKISNTADGISFYYTPLNTGETFQFTAKAYVESFTANNQVSFGLMLRNNIGAMGNTAGHTSNFVAVGALNQKMQAFSRTGTGIIAATGAENPADAAAKLAPPIDLIAALPKAGDEYTLRMIKTGDKCIVTCGSQTAVISTTSLFTGSRFYLGLFTARNTRVTFSDINLITNVDSIAITGQPSKTDYLVGQDLDLTGLEVKAEYSGGGTGVIPQGDYAVTGYDKNTEGTQAITVSYGGKTASFNVNVMALRCTAMNVVYTPAKTLYYLGDPLDTLGMVINGTFNSGAVRALDPTEYTLAGFDSSTAGEKTITAVLNANPEITASFNVTVKDSELLSIEITRQPVKTLYYIGDKLDLTGMVISAVYSDAKEILQSNEYAVDQTGFDTAAAGEKTVIISFKGKTEAIRLTVKVRDLVGIRVTTLPKTTYYVGEAFNPSGMVVKKVYDNSDTMALAESEYTLDSAAFRSDTPGVYDMVITPADPSLAAITFPVTVRAQTTYTWKSIIFGQSTSATTNSVTASAPGTVNGTIALSAGSNTLGTIGGKVTGAHDGISFYYTELDATRDNFVLSADIKVIDFAKPTPDNQEAFGLMARDAVGTNGDSSVFSSNVVGVGGYRGTTQAFIRTGVVSSLGNEGTVQTATAWNTVRPAAANTYPAATYRLTLAKTNSGFTASLNNAEATTVTFYEPDILNVQDSKIYVGFYTARVATIEVSNVSFSVSAAATDGARVLPPAAPVVPAVNVVSFASSSESDYTLNLISNVNGTVTIKQGETVIANNAAVTGNQVFAQNATLPANSQTNFTITLAPDGAQVLTSYNKLVTHFAVTMKTYETADGAIYVSPTGTSAGAGTKEDPLDLETAIMYVKKGQTIYMLGGTYNRTTPVTIPTGNDGAPAAMKSLAAYNGETVVFDFGTKSAGFTLAGSYWNIFGLDFTRASAAGLTVSGSHNRIELCDTYTNGNTGLSIARMGTVSREYWPSYNLILNCTSYDNKDSSENNADGFAAKLACGEGNVFRGCISHNNIDDGWDLYTKAETGPIGIVLLEDCIAYNGGVLTNGYVGSGDKNGFKLGGEGIAVPHIIRNCIAFGNGATGFTSNSNPAVRAFNCVSYDNTGANIDFSSYNGIPLQFEIKNVVSYRSSPGTGDNYPASAISDANYFCNGTVSVNKSGVVLDNTDFASLIPPIPYSRDAGGNIIRGDFLKFTAPPIPITSPSVAVADDGSNKNLAITQATLDLGMPVVISVPASVTDAALDAAELLNAPVGGTVTTKALPAMKISAATSINTAPVQLAVPAGLTVSAPEASNWKGIIHLPGVQPADTVTVTPDPGKTVTVNAVIEVGSGDVPLTLSRAVRILIPGQAGKNVGYYRNGVFTKITTVLHRDSQAVADLLPAGKEGWMNVGSDLVIWTKHFTKFVVYTQTRIAPANSTTGSAVVYPYVGGTVSLGSDAEVEIPVHALKGNTGVTVAIQKAAQPPAAPAGKKLFSPAYDFTVDGRNDFRFASKVTITLKFDASLSDMHKAPSICYYDEAASKWVSIGGKVNRGTITVEVDRFAKFAVIGIPKAKK